MPARWSARVALGILLCGCGSSDSPTSDGGTSPADAQGSQVCESNSRLDWVWLAEPSGSSDVSWVSAAGVGSDGSIVAAGSFVGTVRFGPLTELSTEEEISYLMSLDDTGTVEWVQTMAADADKFRVSAIAVDSEGSAAVVGWFQGTVDFGRGALVSQGGFSDGFVASFDSDGAHQWSYRFGTTEDGSSSGQEEAVQGIGVDSDDNLYLVGTLSAPASVGGDVLPHTGARTNAYLASFTKDGVHRFSTSFGPSSASARLFVRDFAVNASADIALATRAGITELMLYDATGARIWTRQLSSTNTDGAQALALDDSGAVHVVGSFANAAELDTGVEVTGPFWAKYGPDGALVDSSSFTRGQWDTRQLLAISSPNAIAAVVPFDSTYEKVCGSPPSVGLNAPLHVLDDSDGDVLWSQALLGVQPESLQALPTGFVLAGQFDVPYASVATGDPGLSADSGFIARFATQ